MTMEEEFEIVWRGYPRKIAKATARLAFKKARKLATVEEILEGITRYVANKPDWMDYKHPATWLRSEGWSDEWEPPQPKAPRYGNPQYQPITKPSQSREDWIRAELERSERSFR